MTATAEMSQSSHYAPFDSMPIAGEWRAGHGAATISDLDPWSGGTLAEIPAADASDLDAAFTAARSAQPAWSSLPPSERAGVMSRAAQIMTGRRDEIIDWLIHEVGGSVTKSTTEWMVVRADFLQAARLPYQVEGRILGSDIPGKEHRVYRQPVGVVLLISPWNWPLHLTTRSLAPALAVGNGVVIKPATDTPVTGGLLLARILEEAGLPPGVLNVVVGRGADIGDAAVEHPVPRVISFTGSTAVGLGITRKAGVKRLCLELGGNGPLVVLDDADLDLAAEAAVYSSFFFQGQICMITNRVIVDASINDAFVDAFVERVRALKVGDPSDPSTQIGPVINAKQLASVQDKVARSRAAGARVLLDGSPTGPIGSVLPPHVLLGGPDLPTAREEVFGPVITILEADGEEHSLTLANDTEYGLTSCVFTRDVERGARFALRIETGMGYVNDSSVNDEPHVAFGGEKQSGYGRFGGQWAMEEFTTDHLVSVQHQRLDYRL
jgi:aldehyde dehydrogenase (NAD+)